MKQYVLCLLHFSTHSPKPPDPWQQAEPPAAGSLHCASPAAASLLLYVPASAPLAYSEDGQNVIATQTILKPHHINYIAICPHHLYFNKIINSPVNILPNGNINNKETFTLLR